MNGRQLKALRIRLGLTQQRFAEICAVSEHRVQKNERRGAKYVDMEMARAAREAWRYTKIVEAFRHLEHRYADLEARMLRIDGLRETSPWEKPILFEEADHADEG